LKILLVNDDSLSSRNLELAYNVLIEFGDVVTIAPLWEKSAFSMATETNKFRWAYFEKNVYGVDGSPVDCVNFGLFSKSINQKFDLVVSGINRGFNIGSDIRYSGTVSAALHAHYMGFNAIAFSSDPSNTKGIERYFESTLKYILENKLHEEDYMLNVNFPREGSEEEAKIVFTEPFYMKSEIVLENNNSVMSVSRKIIEAEAPEGTDWYAVNHNQISLTKLQFRA